MHVKVTVRQIVDYEHIIEVDSATYTSWSGGGTIKHHVTGTPTADRLIARTVEEGQRTPIGAEITTIDASGPARKPPTPTEGES